MKRRNRVVVESLENRLLMAVVSVLNNNDSGAGSLREAITQANSGDTVDLSGRTGTITLNSEIAFAKDLTIAGPGSGVLTISGGNATRAFNLTGGSVTVSDMKFSHGSSGNGGAIYNRATLVLSRVVFDANHATTQAGAVFNYLGSLTATDCTFTNNVCTSPTFSAEGGAIQTQGGSLTLTNCTFANNSAIAGGDMMMGGSGYGGALSMRGDPIATLTNCTFTGNTAKGGPAGMMMPGTGYGGAISTNNSGGSFTMVNCTVVNNSALSAVSGSGQGWGGGIYSLWGGAATQTLKNTIVWGNTAATNVHDVGPNVSSFTDGGNNLIGVVNSAGTFTDGVNGTRVGADPLLGALADNGGPTQTIALQVGSPAIDAASAITAPATDQRGFARVAGPDIGAFEHNASGNQAPAFSSTAVTTAASGSAYAYGITTTDGDDDAVTITAPTKPAWLTVTDNGDGTAALGGAPSAFDGGTHAVVLRVDDGHETVEQAFDIDVVVPRWTLDDNGVLTISGGAEDDDIHVWTRGDQLRAVRNGVTKHYPLASVSEVWLLGGDGNDTLRVNTRSVPAYVLGGAGHDRLFGGDEADNLVGGGGKDLIDAGGGDDRLDGHNGDDTLIGGAGDDRLYGGDGNDVLIGGEGADKLRGEAGDDRLLARDRSADLLTGGDGDDKAEYDSLLDTLADVLAAL